MFAEACPGNPSRLKQQAGVREVSFSALHGCHHRHAHRCDRLINMSHIYRQSQPLILHPKNISCKFRSPRGGTCRSGVCVHAAVEALAGFLVGNCCRSDPGARGERLSLLSSASAGPALSSTSIRIL